MISFNFSQAGSTSTLRINTTKVDPQWLQMLYKHLYFPVGQNPDWEEVYLSAKDGWYSEALEKAFGLVRKQLYEQGANVHFDSVDCIHAQYVNQNTMFLEIRKGTVGLYLTLSTI